MPKPRADLQTVAYRIDRRIRGGDASAVPIYPLTTEWSSLDRWPSVVLLLESLRIRLPALYSDSRRRYETKFERPWYNRVTIRPAVLNSRFVGVGRKAPDYGYLLGASREERRSVGVIETSHGLKRRIYEVVEDISHGLRQPVHIRAQYNEERAQLETIRFQFKDRLRKQRAGMLTLTEQEVETAELTSAQIGHRLSEIDRILLDRVTRETSLRSYAQQSNLQLFFLAQSLANFTGGLQRTGRFNREAVRKYLQDFCIDLAMFGSREVRPLRNYARIQIERTIREVDLIEVSEAARRLKMAVEHLTQAAVVMSRWADDLSEDEKTVANLILPAATTQLRQQL